MKKKIKDNEGDDPAHMLQELNPYELAEFRFITTDPQHRKITLENYIMVIGSHARILSHEPTEPDLKQYLNSLLPEYPQRERIRKNFVKTISPVKILQGVEIQRAEESGIITALMEAEYISDLKNKVSLLHAIATELNLIDMSKVIKAISFIPLEGGLTRKGYKL